MKCQAVGRRNSRVKFYVEFTLDKTVEFFILFLISFICYIS